MLLPVSILFIVSLLIGLMSQLRPYIFYAFFTCKKKIPSFTRNFGHISQLQPSTRTEIPLLSRPTIINSYGTTSERHEKKWQSRAREMYIPTITIFSHWSPISRFTPASLVESVIHNFKQRTQDNLYIPKPRFH